MAWLTRSTQRKREEAEREVRKLNGPVSSMGTVIEYNWRINGPSLWEMEGRRQTVRKNTAVGETTSKGTTK